MSRIDELIQQFCPDGVEYKPLEKITYYSSERVAASTLTAQNYIGVDNLLPNKKGKTISEYVPSNGNFIKYRRNNILIGNIRPYLKKIWLATHDGGTNGDVLVICIAKEYELQIIPDFLYYLLSSDDFFYYDMQYAKGAKMPRGNKNIIMEYQVPVPPLPVQEEIVRILDKFTALEAELEAELEARRKQYEFYRDQLLTFGDEVEWKPLGEIIISLKTGLNPRKNFNLNTPDANNYYVTVRELNGTSVVFYDKTDRINDDALRLINNRSKLEIGDLLFSGTGTIGRTAFISENPVNWNIKEGVYVIKPQQEKINPKYLLYILNTTKIRQQIDNKVVGSPVSSIPMAELKKIYIPLPPLAEQERIVAILDKFDALANDISSGLPAELEMRRKQYEYYRDRLLTFKPLAKEA